VRDEERLDDALLELVALLQVVRNHQDGALVHHLVEKLVSREDLLQRLGDRHVFELHRIVAILERALVGDVDTRRLAEEVQDAAQARLVEAHQRGGRVQVEQRRWRRVLPRRLAQLLHRGARARLDLIADRPLQFDHLAGDLPVRRVHLAGAPVFTQRVLELPACLEDPRLIEMRDRGADHRALERNPERRVIGIFLDCTLVVVDGHVPVAHARRAVAAAEGAAGGTSGDERDEEQYDDDPGV
jgi:hypothetical protein